MIAGKQDPGSGKTKAQMVGRMARRVKRFKPPAGPFKAMAMCKRSDVNLGIRARACSYFKIALS